jgi:hypothetical protein
LLAIARAAHLIGDQELKRAALAMLRDHGIEVRFRQAASRRKAVHVA